MGFGAPDVPRFTCKPANRPREEQRGSSSDRGYDSTWYRLSKWHAKREPLCRECYFRGRKTPWELTNHVLPVRDRPDLRLDRENLSSMCKAHHDTVIRELEDLAREKGDIGLMVAWLADPASRPGHHAYEAKGFPRILRERADENRPATHQRRR